MSKIIAIPAFKDNYIWALHSLEGDKIIIIDPGDASPVLDYLQANKLSLHAILITHHHFDHSGGIQALQAKFSDILVYGSKHEFVEGVTSPLEEGSQLHFPNFNLTLNILEIPGHT
ncbi:MAG TPA: MBL fold metallo-hydrolase, partial [Candidatus Berkiella sp.]|nr:MBL fold metallo-hydrolase [Candidatus Berkiella sp.]